MKGAVVLDAAFTVAGDVDRDRLSRDLADALLRLLPSASVMSNPQHPEAPFSFRVDFAVRAPIAADRLAAIVARVRDLIAHTATVGGGVASPVEVSLR